MLGIYITGVYFTVVNVSWSDTFPIITDVTANISRNIYVYVYMQDSVFPSRKWSVAIRYGFCGILFRTDYRVALISNFTAHVKIWNWSCLCLIECILSILCWNLSHFPDILFISCKDCDKCYFGQTRQHLKHRPYNHQSL